jgi:hypothetical protein
MGEIGPSPDLKLHFSFLFPILRRKIIVSRRNNKVERVGD